MDKRDPAFWRSVKPDTTITLTDEQALRESVHGLSYLVREVMTIKDLDGICEWLFFMMDGDGDTPDAWLMVKIVDKEVGLRVYFEDRDSIESIGFRAGNREDMVDSERLWLFQEPEGEEFEYSELQYAQHIGWDFPGDEEGDDDIHVDYNVKGGGEMQCTVTYDPHIDDQRDLIVTIVEYDTSDETTCPEMLLIEIGRSGLDEGGLIRMMFGNAVRPEEIDALAVTTA